MRKYAAATVLGLRVPDYPAVWANQVAGLSGWFSRAYGDAPGTRLTARFARSFGSAADHRWCFA